jgi:UDP-N-acetylmuramate dehydrogenase
MAIAMTIDGARLIARLPKVRGRLQPDFALADITWFRTGGPAEVLFVPADEEDLAQFLAALPDEVPVTVIGIASNLLVRDGGVPGVVVRLGRQFGAISVEEGARVRAGAAVPDVRVARFALDHGIAKLTFLRGIPGSIGGALRMNGGAYGRETRDVLIEARAVDRKGEARVLSNAEMDFGYRHCGAPDDLVFVEALLQGEAGEASVIEREMNEITTARESTQPVKSRTGGSTFKNPDGLKAWELIDKAGLRGFAVGNARVSEKHCNFLINEGGASAADIEELGETIRQRVMETSGVMLEWEIRRIGKPAEPQGAA